jgi:hypothetical protein
MKKFRSFFDPDSHESLKLVLLLWRLKKAATHVVAIGATAAFVVIGITLGPFAAQKSSDERLVTRIETKLKPAAFRQIGPWGRLAGS